MTAGLGFLSDVALVLCVAAVTTLVFQRLRQPVVLGYLLAGMMVGPHSPLGLAADVGRIHTLADLGVILLMFSLGLGFTFGRLARLASTTGIVAVLECSFMLWLGYTLGQLLGFSIRESLFTAGIVAISSTTIVVKAFGEQGVRGKLAELAYGVLIAEDLIAILLLTALTTVSAQHGLTAAGLALTAGRLAAFLVGLVAVGLLVVPRLMRIIVRMGRPETTVVTSVGLCFALALLANAAGYSVALGAFIAGSLVAESGRGRTIEALVQPVRDMFAAIFFVAVGMLIEPSVVVDQWAAVAVLSATVIVGKVIGVSLGSFLTGHGTRLSLQAGMSLAQIGEFSFIIASVGAAVGRDFLYPLAVAVSATTTLLTPWLIRAATPVSNWVDSHLPARLQTFTALYGSWVETIRSGGHAGPVARVRRLMRLLFLDAVLLAGVIITASTMAPEVLGELEAWTGLKGLPARAAYMGTAVVFAAPFVVGIIGIARGLGLALAEMAMPAVEKGTLDRAAAPRLAFVVTLQLGIVLIVGGPLIAVTQAFVPLLQSAVVLAVAVVLLGVGFWRSAANLHGHVRAGTQIIVEALQRQTKARADDAVLDPVTELLPGLGTLVPITLDGGTHAPGKSLAELNVRGQTGAVVLAITRGDKEIMLPTGTERLEPGDKLVLAGAREAVKAAKRLLTMGPEPA